MPTGYYEPIAWTVCPYCPSNKWIPVDKLDLHYELVHMKYSKFERNKKLENLNREN